MNNLTPMSKNRDQVINIRVLASQRELIDRAAFILGKNRSDFMLEVACQQAEIIISDHTFFALDEEKYQQFIDILNSPPQADEVIRNLLMTKSPWEENDNRDRK